MAKIGFIGLGIMGKHMLRNLRKAGHELVAYDIFAASVDAVVGDGVERGASCKDVAARTDVVITMLPDGPEVEQAVLGAAGVLEAILSVLAIRDQVAPPTINYENPDPECDLDYVPNVARPMKIDVAVSNSFGFGGTNGTLVLRRFGG